MFGDHESYFVLVFAAFRLGSALPDSLVGTLQAEMMDLWVVDVPTHTHLSSPRAHLLEVKPGFLADLFFLFVLGGVLF